MEYRDIKYTPVREVEWLSMNTQLDSCKKVIKQLSADLNLANSSTDNWKRLAIFSSFLLGITILILIFSILGNISCR
jgi:hypothetical protein